MRSVRRILTIHNGSFVRTIVHGEPRMDNYFGTPVVVKSDGSIWFTDPSYGRAQGFRAKPQVSNQMYRISMTGVVDAVASDFQQPNGLAFSEDEKRLYVTDTGFETGGSNHVRWYTVVTAIQV